MSIYQSVNAIAFMLPIGASIAGATRVGSALGAGSAIEAKRAAVVCVRLCIGYGCCASLLIALLRTRLGAAFTTSADVLAELSSGLLPNLVLYVIADATQVACGGILQGCGRQRAAGPVVLLSYYLIGLPTGAALAFGAKWGAVGIVRGALLGKLVHCFCYTGLVLRTDWASEVRHAAERVAKEQEKAATAQIAAARNGSSTLTTADESHESAAWTQADTDGVPMSQLVEGQVEEQEPSEHGKSKSKTCAAGAVHVARKPQRYAKLDEL